MIHLDFLLCFTQPVHYRIVPRRYMYPFHLFDHERIVKVQATRRTILSL